MLASSWMTLDATKGEDESVGRKIELTLNNLPENPGELKQFLRLQQLTSKHRLHIWPANSRFLSRKCVLLE
jgi:hypothetical protein